jgi:membrane protein required for colicin V production
MNVLDIIVIAVIALSALFAFARGFVKEALAIAAWAGAGLITLYGLPYARPFAQELIPSPMLASGAAGLALFIVSLVVLSLLTSVIAGRVKNSSLSAVDRALGLVFGLVRGVLIVCVGFIALRWAIQERDWPVWIQQARTRPFLASGADFLTSLVPAGTREKGAAAASQAQQGIEQAREAEQLMRQLTVPTAPPPGGKAPGATGYNSAERREMDRLIESTK